MPTTFASYVDTDKEMVAGLVVNSKLFQCLKVANQNGLKAEAAATVAKEISLANAPEMKELNGGDCSENGLKVSAETYYQRGKALVALNEYKAAMACLMRAQNEEKDTVVYRDACTQIATMYELGWGVDKDIETSKSWLNKAGL